jgi:hypothetical protein
MALRAVPGFKQLGAALRIAVLGPRWGNAERRKKREFGDMGPVLVALTTFSHLFAFPVLKLLSKRLAGISEG